MAAARAAAVTSSRYAVSRRSWSAVRARVAATPGPSSSSSSGSTRVRTRTRVKRSSALWGSDHGSRPSTTAGGLGLGAGDVEQRPAEDLEGRRIPASERAPAPRARPSSTVSAWSSRVWPSSTAAAEKWRAISPSTAYLASRAAASGPRPVGGDRDPGAHRLVDAEVGELLHHPRGLLGRAVLQAVVDGRADDPQRRRARPRRRWPPPGRASRRRRCRRPGRWRRARGRPAHGVRRGAPRRRRGAGSHGIGLSRGRGRPTARGRGSRPCWAGCPARPRRR